MTFRIPMILNNEQFTGLGATILEAHIPYISCISVSDSLSFSFFLLTDVLMVVLNTRYPS